MTLASDVAPSYFDQRREELVGLLAGTGLRVLELGCASGRTGEWMRMTGQASLVHGIEAAQQPATEAAFRLDKVWQADIESFDVSTLEPPYDAIVVADVLEHVRDPWDVLERFSGLLTGSGQVVASIPNIRYFPVVANLLVRGHFDYQEHGVLDRTHLRFFTRLSIQDLFRGAGLTCVTVQGKPLSRIWKRALAAPFRDLGVRQFLVHAVRP